MSCSDSVRRLVLSLSRRIPCVSLSSETLHFASGGWSHISALQVEADEV